MRFLRAFGLLLLLTGMATLVGPVEAHRAEAKKDKDGKGKEKGRFADVNDLHAEVTVLQVLQSLQPTPRQLSILLKVAKKTMAAAPPKKKIEVSDKYRKALQALRNALIGGNEETIDEASTTLDDIRESGEDPDFEDIEVTDAARDLAPGVLRRFSARQIVLYVGGLDDFPDPTEQLRNALVESQKRKGKEWSTYRDDIAYQVGWLVAGLDSTKEKAVRKAATALLTKAAKMDEEEFSKKRPELEKNILTVVEKIGPTDVIRNFMERLLAETLSNYRLAAVIEAKLARLKSKDSDEKPKEKTSKEK